VRGTNGRKSAPVTLCSDSAAEVEDPGPAALASASFTPSRRNARARSRSVAGTLQGLQLLADRLALLQLEQRVGHGRGLALRRAVLQRL
jgi:hypothetical protein